MTRSRVALLVWAALLPLAATGAEVTRIASSFDENDPFDLYFDVGFDRTQTRMLISREFHDGTDVVYKKELRYTGVDTRLNLDLHVGVWHDVEFTIGLPVDFADNETWQFAAGTTAATSSITNNCLNSNGTLTDPNCPVDGTASNSLFPMTGGRADAYRGGLGNIRFGLAWAPFNQTRDDTKPMWVVGLNYEGPTADRLNPSIVTAADARGKIGDRVHKYTLYTAFSRRMGIADPYFRAYYTLPYKGPHWYSNCDQATAPDATATLSFPGNCGLAGTPWTREATGIQMPQRAGFTFGSEFVVYDQPDKQQRIAFDVRAVGDYVGVGRYYNQMAGVLRKFLYTGDYMKFGGLLGVYALASDYVSVKATAQLLYNTDHYLTDEPIGKDVDGNGVIDYGAGGVPSPEISPTFDYRYDMTSRRFRASEINEFKIDITATFSF